MLLSQNEQFGLFLALNSRTINGGWPLNRWPLNRGRPVSVLVPEIFKFEKWVKYANEMTDDVIHSTQYYIKHINGAILANFQCRALKLDRLIALQETHLWL